ncbi:MAG: peroxiredoxin [Candidatus Sungbacteria bacterium]|uniref:Peroxiredoxin n=1 Tax=Candidatus Sungiibacteriota bacterium TaxID=2750080 RepID=A0A932YXT0_9BACT|nr:peroxiredoxin [Candidatus Sungbacteria bacterium]
MFTVDKKFPVFSLPAYFPERGEDGLATLADFAGKWLILFWYPADFTFVCPTELADIQQRLGEYRTLGAEVLGASTDTVYTHKGWVDHEELLADLKYPLAADHTGAFARELGIYDETNGMAQRAAFIIDPEGVLRAADIVADAIGRSAGELLRKLKALKFTHDNPGKVCPASWDTGDPTLSPSIKIAGKVKGALGA